MMTDNQYAAWYYGMIHRVNGYQYLRFFLMPYYSEDYERVVLIVSVKKIEGKTP